MARKTLAYIVDPTLGHVARAFRIARQLREDPRLRVVFIAPDQRIYARRFLAEEFELHLVDMRGPNEIAPYDRLAPGLERALAEVGPDLIVHDLCPLRYLSTTRLPDCPRVHVTNLFLTGPAGQDTFQRRWFAEIAGTLNATRRDKGLPTVTDVGELYEADRVLCADPEFVAEALPPLPGHYRLLGDITLELDLPVPDELRAAEDLMILSMGSTGADRFAPGLLAEIRAFSGSGRVIYVGRPVPGLDELELLQGRYEWLPLHRILDRARIVVTQGGTGATYQALRHGRPVAVLPEHRNHEILGAIVQNRGAGMVCGDGRAAAIGTDDFARMQRQAIAVGAQMRRRPDGAAQAAREILDLV